MSESIIKQFGSLARNRRGSALVGVVVVSILMGIVSVGYLQVSASVANNELQQLSDASAFHAAESGLLLGTRWLAQQGLTAWPNTRGESPIFTDIPINGASVTVKDSIDVNGKVFIVSTATHGKLSYVKRIRWLVDSALAGGMGNIINDLNGVPRGISGVTIDGPAHFNDDILVANGAGANSNLFMNGLVSVHSSPTKWINSGLGDQRTGYQNDYSYGVHRANGSFTADDADDYFKDKYLSKQDSIVLNYTIDSSIVLPGTTDNTRIPTLNFQAAGGAVYTYYNAGTASWQNVTYPKNTSDGKVFVSPVNAHVNVYGTVNGQLSLATRGTGDIRVVGELKYANTFTPSPPVVRADGTYVNSGNYGVLGTDVVALFSNNNLSFEGTWTDAGVSKNFIAGSGANAYIAGMLYAKNTMNKNNMKGNNSATNVYFLGTRSAKTFGDDFWDRGNDFDPYFLYDSRFGTGDVKPAGVTTSIHRFDPNGAGNSLSVKPSGWIEQNIAL